MSYYLCLTPIMLKVIASCSGIVYFVEPMRCTVKMNGVLIEILRMGDDWLVKSSCQPVYDFMGRYGKSVRRGLLISLNETQLFSVLNHFANKNGEE